MRGDREEARQVEALKSAEALYRVALTMGSEASVERILDVVLAETQRLVPTRAANICLVRGATLEVVRAVGYEPLAAREFVANLVQRIDDLSISASVLRGGTAHVVTDTARCPGWVTYPDTSWIRAFLALPIAFRGRPLGLLRLDADVPGAFSEADAARLEPLATAAAAVLENARLAKSERKTSARIRRLHDAATALAACPTEEDVYRITIDTAEHVLGFPMCTFTLFDGGMLVVKANSSRIPPGASVTRSLDSGLAGKTYRTGKTHIHGSEVPEARPVGSGFASGISAPIGKLGVFQVVSRQPDAFDEDDAGHLELLLNYAAEALNRIRLQQELRSQAIHDPLTGVYNRRHLEEVIRKEVAHAERYGHSLAFVMVDIDGFKAINDQLGHAAGDAVLRETADLLQRNLRACDTVIRYGGDEFLLVLPETDGVAELPIARIREALRKRNADRPLGAVALTLSIGVARWRQADPQPVEVVLHEADRRMYEAKERYERGDASRDVADAGLE